jgi:quercetin dioxygenase-like cupin family protein
MCALSCPNGAASGRARLADLTGQMATKRLSDLKPVLNRPGTRSRQLIGSEHGVTSLFVDELLMESGAWIPLHTHSVEETFLVTDGALIIRIGDETFIADAESVVRIPPETPHALQNSEAITARALAAAPWDRATFFRDATTYLEGQSPE